jgi:hypothetical protein
MTDNLGVIEKNGRFVVVENGKILRGSRTDSHNLVTEFDNKNDAEKYMSIIKTVRAKKQPRKIKS